MSSSPSMTTQSRPDRKFLLDIEGIDMSATIADRDAMFQMIPHRHEMALLDRIVWAQDGGLSGIGAMKVQGDEFCV